MRIAILTLPLHTNYGGILQAYALQTVLERMGHDVKVLSPPPYKAHSAWVMPIVYCKRIIEKVILRRDVSILYDGHNRMRQYTDKFIKRYIHSYIVTDWKKLEGKFDAYVVGSDQIWRPKYATMFSSIPNAYLAFTKGWNVKRIAYAVSFGTDLWEYSEPLTGLCKQLVQSFDNVSVREDCGVALCQEHFDIDVKHVLDPTMLLLQADYDKLIGKTRTKPCEGKLMCYILDPNPQTELLIKHYEDKLGLKAYMTNSMVQNAKAGEMIQQPVEQWLRSFKDAEYVITDSFHACVFSILFKKQFIVLSNESRGNARIDSLLSMFGIEDRKVSLGETDMIHRPIDYTSIVDTLNTMRSQSINYIADNIN